MEIIVNKKEVVKVGLKRIVDTEFWTDEKVLDTFSPEDKLFFLYLMTNPHTTQLGIYYLHEKYISLELGYTVDSVKVLIDRFENKYQIIKYSQQTKEVAIENYLKYSIVKGGKPVEDCLIREIKQVKDKSLLKYIYNNISNYKNLNTTVKNILSLLNYEEDNEKDNVNDNDNDVSYHDTLEEEPSTKKKQSVQKHKYGEYQNVLLKDEEKEKWKRETIKLTSEVSRLRIELNKKDIENETVL